MALSAAYNGDLSRIVLSADLLGVTAEYAVFDRTLNGITYTTVRGGSEVPVVSEVAEISDYEFPTGELITYRVRSYDATDVLLQTVTTTITQASAEVWLKVPARPYLNRPVVVTEVGEVTRAGRNGIFPIPGRSYPVSVSDVRGSRQFSIEVMTVTETEAQSFDLLLMSGDTVYLQAPEGFPVPSVYAVIGDTTATEPARGDPTRLFNLPLTEVAQPGPHVVGSTYTITSMLAEYATITAVIADNPRIIDLLGRVANATEVIVP